MARRKLLLLIGWALLATGIFWAQGTSTPAGFSIDQITSSLSPQNEWKIAPISDERQRELKTICSSRFNFLGEGAQAYAFESGDGKYVLKFFKMRRFTPSLIDYLCPHVVRRRLKNLRWVFNGYKIAYEEFREDTGLLFIHLAKTEDLHQQVIVVDEKGEDHTIDLDQTEFVLQEKAQLLFPYLASLYKKRDFKGAQTAITQVLNLIQRRIDKGYADRDKAVSNNYGFVRNRPIQLDVGRLYRGTKEGQRDHVAQRIERWQQENQSIIEKVN